MAAYCICVCTSSGVAAVWPTIAREVSKIRRASSSCDWVMASPVGPSAERAHEGATTCTSCSGRPCISASRAAQRTAASETPDPSTPTRIRDRVTPVDIIRTSRRGMHRKLCINTWRCAARANADITARQRLTISSLTTVASLDVVRQQISAATSPAGRTRSMKASAAASTPA